MDNYNSPHNQNPPNAYYGSYSQQPNQPLDPFKQDNYIDQEMGENIGADFINKQMRLGFIRKVYGILSFQLLLTVALASFSFFKGYKEFAVSNQWLLWLCVALTIILIIPLACFKSVARTVPTNYILLTVWTLCEAYIVSFLCSFYSASVVITAAALTAAIVVGLTVYACTTKTDFTWMGGILCVVCILMIFLGIFSIFFSFLNTLYCVLGVFLFSIYLIYDTQLVMGKFGTEFSIEDYILAAINIYLDIIQIFLYLLRLLGDDRR